MDYCADCTYLVPEKSKGDSKGYFYCEKKYSYFLATEEHCYDFCRAYSRPDWEIKNLLNRSDRERNGYDKSGCYITTIVCDILGFQDDCIALSTIRNLRDNYLCKDEKYKALLVEYDILGPIIAKAIYTDKNKMEIANNLYDHILVPIVLLIDEKNYESATNMYLGMTKGLLIGFGYDNLKVDETVIKNADIKESGHGKQKVKK